MPRPTLPRQILPFFLTATTVSMALSLSPARTAGASGLTTWIAQQ